MFVMLTVTITFRDIDFNFIEIHPETCVFYDEFHGIAFYKDNHFFLDRGEFVPIN